MLRDVQTWEGNTFIRWSHSKGTVTNFNKHPGCVACKTRKGFPKDVALKLPGEEVTEARMGGDRGKWSREGSLVCKGCVTGRSIAYLGTWKLAGGLKVERGEGRWQGRRLEGWAGVRPPRVW